MWLTYYLQVAESAWPHKVFNGITWVTEPKRSEKALIHVCYGNQASINTQYSKAVIFAVIPPWFERDTTSG